jgi:cobalt-precorrin-5B (C1)-methyltransferase
MTRKPEGPLRRGWTTGACATAATKAAFTAMITGQFPDPVEITLPKGETPSFALAKHQRGKNWAMAGIVKDAGDDPDVTHLALIQSKVKALQTGSGIQFKAGPGVGTVTKAGLPVEVGEPAINPVPRRMMAEVIEETAIALGAEPDVEIEISVPGGEEIAKQTWNPRLGIVGGISILGTTGIVHPFSCSAWIASIHRGIDVIRAAGLEHAAACTGSTTESAVQQRYGLPDFAFIDMGDFAGATLKYLRHHPVKRLTLAGGFGKFCKLADGFLDLHSGRSQVNLQHLAEWAGERGANELTRRRIAEANTAMEALSIAQQQGIPLAQVVADKAHDVAREHVNGKVAIELLVYDRDGKLVGSTDFA